ncbi:MAG: hypothetical protein A2Y10_13160 [Planctomycetes bacterium GWF2_41_51]|nr:MAG: hypothetical protein A2Y10_13160 [Planctomycetes bacterium GWF2_41_51]
MINLDPGYLNDTQVIIASTKKYGNRVYLRDGIYADLTLYFNRRTFCPVSKMTFLDYKTSAIIKFFNYMRKNYIGQINQFYQLDRQNEFWRQEYLKKGTYTSTKALKPSPSLSILINYLDNNNSDTVALKILDIGCGVGRNSLPFAKNGAEIFGTDIIEEPLNIFKEKALKYGLENKIHLQIHRMTERFPFRENFFDVIMDITSSVNILKLYSFKIYFKKLAEISKIGGCLFLVTFDESDEYYCWLKEKYHEGHFITDPNNTIVSRVYTREQIIGAAENTAKLLLEREDVIYSENVIADKSYNRAYRCFLWKRI